MGLPAMDGTAISADASAAIEASGQLDPDDCVHFSGDRRRNLQPRLKSSISFVTVTPPNV
jgi:hypothetical protein